MSEKMDEDASAENEKTFQIVSSPDADQCSVTSLHFAEQTATRPAQFATPEIDTSDRDAFPASSGGALLYLQSPVHHQGFSTVQTFPESV